MNQFAAEKLLAAVRAGYVSESHTDVAIAKAVLGRKADAVLTRKPWDDAVHHCIAGCFGSGRRR
jgi:molybdate-binding protein